MQNLDYQQPSEKDIVQPEDNSNVPTEKCLENVGIEFEKYVDVDSWSKSLNKQLKEQLRKDTEYYHNVLKRVVTIVKYLAMRGLAFRGTEEVFGSTHNEILETNGLLLHNCRGQSFDNDANMSSPFNDVEAVLIEKNKFANYVPCTAPSLNLPTGQKVNSIFT
ncbi:zinc finger MYM-type protein 1 [Trichonephila clavipes]|nr:zinc finger MYM-type protein 1 [Trichonephila clavipes]